MKKLLLAVLAIAAMAACTKSNVQLEQPGEISFQPVTQKATKAVVDGNTYPTAAAYNFNIWAWWGNHNAETSLTYFVTDIKPYIAHGTFKHKDETNWGGVTPYYWPSKGSLVFAGYSPADTSGTISYDFTQKIFTVKGYKQSNNIDDAKDLMWFDVTDESYDQNVSATKGIHVTFQHALSWLTFKFNLKDSSTDKRWTITNVKLTGIEDKATFTATKGGTTSWTAQVKSTTDSDSDIINVFTGNYTVEYNENGTVLPGTDVEVKDSYGNVTGVKDNAVLVIPQSCAPATPTVPAAAELFITYKLKTYIGDNNYLEGQTITLPLNGTIKDTQNTYNEWLPGKHYIYTITFGANEILIAPSVENWGDMPVENIPIQ